MDALATQRARSGPRGEVAAPALALDGLALARDGRTVLGSVNAVIAPGEFIGVFGPNGAGKTTLIHAILGLLRPAAGSLRVFGAVPRRGNRDAGYLPQQRSPVGDLRLCGRDFVASAFRGERWGLPLLGRAGRREVDWAIATVEAEALAARPLCELSGGERQRLLLAQALLGKPRLLLLDEPLVSLDPHFQHAVVALVGRIQRELGITVLFTAHDLNLLLGTMDRVLYLGRGQAALGSVEEVMTSEVLSRLYGMPIEVLRLKGRILVVSAQGEVEAEAHRHDA
ncbi:MAG TPA: ATP-binding cassette domain-containing protein [Alphaproteobacteria bacterium]|nr:ATP-binding cassette domain-containing protein [Alphaproteobacteria bacterium]